MKEKKCPVTRLPIIHKPEWDVFHSGPDYRVVFETIGTDIIHARVSAERGTYLDFIDKELFRLVCDELKVEEKKVYVVIDYDPIREVRLSYKQDYANLFYNWGPWIALLVVYNVHPDIRTDMESLGALCPLKSQAMIVDSYDDAMKSVLEAQELFGQYAVPGVVAVNSEEDLKNRFLAAVARLSWLDLVDHPIDFPPAGSGREGYFQALDALRMDLLEGEELHEQKIAAIKKEYATREAQYGMQINLLSEESRKIRRHFETERGACQDILALKETELAGVANQYDDTIHSLSSLCDHIGAADIDPKLQKVLVGLCSDLSNREQECRVLGRELTEADVGFLSALESLYPLLTGRERRVCLFIKLNYSSREMARILGVSVRGVENIRYRLHKKLGLDRHQSLKNYFSKLVLGPAAS
ncbi:MAG: LuxR family transcriptional regulator [Candidatus Chlorobium antarcticum]|jgi:DNA-binding CsgD family transcriptional regulator|nr:LuxR family transcriptional regulator [Candidatus Chlorobium antarcticum]